MFLFIFNSCRWLMDSREWGSDGVISYSQGRHNVYCGISRISFREGVLFQYPGCLYACSWKTPRGYNKVPVFCWFLQVSSVVACDAIWKGYFCGVTWTLRLSSVGSNYLLTSSHHVLCRWDGVQFTIDSSIKFFDREYSEWNKITIQKQSSGLPWERWT